MNELTGVDQRSNLLFQVALCKVYSSLIVHIPVQGQRWVCSSIYLEGVEAPVCAQVLRKVQLSKVEDDGVDPERFSKD